VKKVGRCRKEGRCGRKVRKAKVGRKVLKEGGEGRA
jgi:hypothetical protein